MKSSKRTMLARAGAAVGAAAMVAGVALPANASTTQPGPVNYEWLSGFAAGQNVVSGNPIVPLQLHGAVDTHGFLNLGGMSSVSRIHTFEGSMAVAHGDQMTPPQLNWQTCRETDIVSTGYLVLGGQSTGVFWQARGFGHATVVFSAIVPRFPNGQCDFSPNVQPLPFGAFIAFRAQGPLFLRHHF